LADSRQVYVHPELRLVLQKLVIPDSKWLFPSPINRLNPISFQSVSQGLNRALARVGLKHLGISTHSTRRTFITRLANAGVNLHDIKALTGHKNMESLMRYIDNNPEAQKAAILSL
jgi:integrase/recombinase XerD